MLTLVIIVCVVAYGIYYHFTRKFDYWKNKNVRGPKPIPLFGNIKDSALRLKHSGDVYKTIYEQFPEEKVVGIYRMTTPALLLRDLEVIKHITIKDFDSFSDRGIEFSKKGLGMNLFHSDELTWRALRNKFTPMFSTSKLKNMFYLINERGDKFIEYVHKNIYSKQPEIELQDILKMYSMTVISACAFGIDMDIMNDKFESLFVMDKVVFGTNLIRELDMMYPGILSHLNKSLFPTNITLFFENLVSKIIEVRNNQPTNRRDFMDLILEIRQRGIIETTTIHTNDKYSIEMTESVMAAQAFVFYVAGYETSATTTAFLFRQLALNPDIQNRLRQEIEQALQKNDGKLTYDVVVQMSYLSKVVDETLRMYPVVDLIQRRANADYNIVDTDVKISKRDSVVFSVYAIHHDKKYYSDPEVFDPERFSPENVSKRHPCAYMPFGVGPRNCIGMRFGKLQVFVSVVKILSNFRLEPTESTQKMKIDPYRILLSPLGGIRLKFIPIK